MAYYSQRSESRTERHDRRMRRWNNFLHTADLTQAVKPAEDTTPVADSKPATMTAEKPPKL